MLLPPLATICWAVMLASVDSTTAEPAGTPDPDTSFEGMMKSASAIMQDRNADFKIVLSTFWAGCPEFDITKNRYTPQKTIIQNSVVETDVVPKVEREAPESAATHGSALWARFGPRGDPADRYRACNALGSTLIHYTDGVATKKIPWFVEDFDAEDAELTNTTFAGDDDEKESKKKRKKRKNKKTITPSSSDKLMVTLRAMLLDAEPCFTKAQLAMDELLIEQQQSEAADGSGPARPSAAVLPDLEEEQKRLGKNLADLKQLKIAFKMDAVEKQEEQEKREDDDDTKGQTEEPHNDEL